ncbi:MAG: UvrD-helicase domain-containing protein [Elusimicrobia bacterium]|nr:UvrD-helicase domain-containing protein [Elusimicrobiota bacterium]
MNNFDGLNDQQRRAVMEAEGPVLIAAGPGTGKTRTLVHRIAHLISAQQIPPQAIMAVTFTRSAALEIKERLNQMLGQQLGEGLWVETFHSAAFKILRTEGRPFGPGRPFSIIGDEEKSGCLKNLVPAKNIKRFLEELSRLKRNGFNPGDPAGRMYQERLSQAGLLDFDDLLLHGAEFLENQEGRGWTKRFRYILVDEFQDTSPAQYRLLRLLAQKNICVIGDPDQAIYSFAGDAFNPLETFRRDFPGCREFSITQNYRSQAMIIDAAKQVIAKNPSPPGRRLEAKLETGLPIEINVYQSDRQEAQMIARRIEGLLGGGSFFTIDSEWAVKEQESAVYSLNDIAILYRLHAQARLIKEALESAGLPLRVYGPKNSGDGETSKTVDLTDIAAEESAVPGNAQRAEMISLMTLHRAKGLEFPVIFIAGCEDGVVPYQKDNDRSGERIEEERRLFYVGITRAGKRLFLSSAKKRFLFGKTRISPCSPFIHDIEERLRLMREDRSQYKPKPRPQPTLFDL